MTGRGYIVTYLLLSFRTLTPGPLKHFDALTDLRQRNRQGSFIVWVSEGPSPVSTECAFGGPLGH